jgi:hypothetical protein
VLAVLTVIDLSGRADVSRADMVLACLVTRVGMARDSSRSVSVGTRFSLVTLVVPLGEVRVGSTPKAPYVSFTLAGVDAEAAPDFWITVQTVI